MSPENDKDWFLELVEILRRLRAPDGCPWDHEQTHASLKHHLLEEVAELFDAIDDNDTAGMVDELGDLLMHIVFHAQIAQDNGGFNIQDVARHSCRKMIRRHPHVFGDASAEDASAVIDQWEAIKKLEPNHHHRLSALDGVPRHLPALQRAQKMQKNVSRVGFDWTSINGVIEKIEEELAEVKEALAAGDTDAIGNEIGDLLFATVNLARWQKLTAEELLHAAARKFETRFRKLEELAATETMPLQDCSPEQLDTFWNQVKALEKD